MRTIDCRRMNCPLPVINTKKYFDSIEEGTAIILVDNEIAKENINKYALGCGYKVNIISEENEFKITISKENTLQDTVNENNFIILITTNKLGEGSEELGEVLMKTYMYTLSENNNLPKKLIFINGGVKLVSNDSQVLESLKALEAKGVEIVSCGVCLDFYKLKDKLAIGSIGNMYSIVEDMNSYKKVIKL